MRLPDVVRWGIKSVGGLAANLALLTVWVDGGGIAPELAIGINWVLISLVSYVFTDQWVFDQAASPGTLLGHAKRYVSMQSVMAGSKVVNYGIFVGLIHIGSDYRLAWAAGAVTVFFGTYAANRKLWVSEIPQA